MSQITSPATSFDLAPDRESWPIAVSVDGEWVSDFRRTGDAGAADVDGWASTLYRSESTGLEAAVSARRLDGALEWRTQLLNGSSERSAVLDGLASLRAVLPAQAAAVVHTRGSRAKPDDFTVHTTGLDEELHFEPLAGRASDQHLPAFVLAGTDRAHALLVGWTGQWSMDVEAADGGALVTVGHASPRLYLEPGEAITLPTVLLVEAADAEAATAATRRYLRRHVVPRRPDGGSVNPIAHMTMSTFHRSRTISTEAELATVEHASSFGIESYWVDACWYGDTPDWYGEVGSWHTRTADFPAGLRPVSDAAHARGMGFIFWMEPERARTDSAWATAHPHLFLSFPDDPGSRSYLAWRQANLTNAAGGPEAGSGNLLLNLGLQEARELMLETVSARITEFDADVYRQDFNVDPLTAWQAADAPDRVGMTGIRHIEGLYWVWDQLLERHPGLVIDNCASGGQRLDLEMFRRSLPLWRSDSADVGGVTGDAVALASQVQQAGIGRWLPDHNGPIHTFDAYSIRSSMATGFVVYRPLPQEGEEVELLRSAIAEIQRVRPLLDDHLYVLVDPSLTEGGWAAFQYHSPETGRGLVIAFRTAGAPDSVSLSLRGIDTSAAYRVREFVEYTPTDRSGLAGAELAELVVDGVGERQSVLIEYEPGH